MSHDPRLAQQDRCRCGACAAGRAARTRRAARDAAARLRAEAQAQAQAAEAYLLEQASAIQWTTAEGVVTTLGQMEDRHLWYAARLLLRRLAERGGPAFLAASRRLTLDAIGVVLRSRGVAPPDGPNAEFRPRRGGSLPPTPSRFGSGATTRRVP